MINHYTHPWLIAVYSYEDNSGLPIRVFDGYLTERDAQGYADHLNAQAKSNGWIPRIIRVQTYTDTFPQIGVR